MHSQDWDWTALPDSLSKTYPSASNGSYPTTRSGTSNPGETEKTFQTSVSEVSWWSFLTKRTLYFLEWWANLVLNVNQTIFPSWLKAKILPLDLQNWSSPVTCGCRHPWDFPGSCLLLELMTLSLEAMDFTSSLKSSLGAIWGLQRKAGGNSWCYHSACIWCKGISSLLQVHVAPKLPAPKRLSRGFPTSYFHLLKTGFCIGFLCVCVCVVSWLL